MEDNYTVLDEFNFIASIASNGQMDYMGKIKNESEMEADGVPKPRTALQRIEFINNYGFLFVNRQLPEGWTEQDRKKVMSYIRDYILPFLNQTRSLQLGDLVA